VTRLTAPSSWCAHPWRLCVVSNTQPSISPAQADCGYKQLTVAVKHNVMDAVYGQGGIGVGCVVLRGCRSIVGTLLFIGNEPAAVTHGQQLLPAVWHRVMQGARSWVQVTSGNKAVAKGHMVRCHFLGVILVCVAQDHGPLFPDKWEQSAGARDTAAFSNLDWDWSFRSCMGNILPVQRRRCQGCASPSLFVHHKLVLSWAIKHSSSGTERACTSVKGLVITDLSIVMVMSRCTLSSTKQEATQLKRYQLWKLPQSKKQAYECTMHTQLTNCTSVPELGGGGFLPLYKFLVLLVRRGRGVHQ